MARKKMPLENIECINKNSCIFKDIEQQKLLVDLKADHAEFKNAIVSFTANTVDIKDNTREMANTLAQFKDDSKEHLKIIAELNRNSHDYFRIIAGKKQVPLPIFIIIVGMLCGLLLASEVRYRGVDFELSWDGIKIINNQPQK